MIFGEAVCADDGCRPTDVDRVNEFEDEEPIVAQPDFLKPPWEPWDADREAQPPVLGGSATGGPPSMSMLMVAPVAKLPDSGTGTVAKVDGVLAILIPFAAAILRSSFCSRFLSFSFCLSTSSFALTRTLACMSLKRAL